MVWLNSWKSCSEAVLKFLGRYGWWRPLLPRCLAYSLERYWRLIPSQIFSCELFEISGNSNPTRLTSLLNMLWAIQQELFFKPILRKFASLPLKVMESFFGESVSLQHQYLLKWNLTIIVLLGIMEIIFWWISQNSYYMEFLQKNW